MIKLDIILYTTKLLIFKIISIINKKYKIFFKLILNLNY